MNRSHFGPFLNFSAVFAILLFDHAKCTANIIQQVSLVRLSILSILLCVHQARNLIHGVVDLECDPDRVRNLRGVINAHADQLLHVVEFVNVFLRDVL